MAQGVNLKTRRSGGSHDSFSRRFHHDRLALVVYVEFAQPNTQLVSGLEFGSGYCTAVHKGAVFGSEVSDLQSSVDAINLTVFATHPPIFDADVSFGAASQTHWELGERYLPGRNQFIPGYQFRELIRHMRQVFQQIAVCLQESR